MAEIGTCRVTVAELDAARRDAVSPPGAPGAGGGEQRRLVPSGFFALRTPLLPFDDLRRWGEGLEAPAAVDQPDLLAGAQQRDRLLLRARLHAILARPEVREALFLGSPDLDEATEVWRRDPVHGRGPGIERALVRYVVRMASRPTPFGLFGGTSVGDVGRRTRIEIAGRDGYRRRTGMDVEYLGSVADAAAAEAGDTLRYSPNTSLYRTARSIRYVEWRRDGDGDGGARRLVSMVRTDALDAALDRAAAGATLPELSAAVAATGAGGAAAARFVVGLIDAQVLVPGIEVRLTGGDPLSTLVDQLRAHPAASAVVRRLEVVSAELAAIDAAGMGTDPERYREIARSLCGLGAPVEMGRLFTVQLVKGAPGATLATAVLDEIRRGVAVLHRLSRPRSRPALDRFREEFERRYGDREIALMEALDEDLGVGFGPATPSAPLLDGLSFPADDPLPPVWGRREAALLAKLEGMAPGVTEITLDPDDVDAMAVDSSLPLPDAVAVVATVAAASDEALDAGDFAVLVDAAGGPSGAWMLGRFCAADPELHARVGDHLAREEAHDPEAVWAEVVHRPVGRHGNVVVRPVLRSHEIPYLGASGAPPGHHIPVRDLYVSVRDGRIVLRSRELGRRVVPRSTTAHDFATPASPPAYRFLCALQVAEVQGGVSWSWGPLVEAPFLPRVRTGRVVLARARWRVDGAELAGLAAGPGRGLPARVRSWQTARGLPRLVSLVDGDRTLLVDLANVLCVEAFLDAARGCDRVVVEEFFPGPDELCARGPEGAFVHELVVPFVAETEPQPIPAVQPTPAQGPAGFRRAFPPGSEWLDTKIYAPPSAADEVLLDAVAPIRDRAFEAGAADAWHFGRGADPFGHLRVRFHGSPEGLRERVLPELAGVVAALLDDGAVWRFQLDTYERPVGRHGGPDGVVVAERVLSADSDAAVAVLRQLAPGDRGADERWRAALVSADLLLDDLGLSEAEKASVLRRRRDALATGVRADARLEGELSRRFRVERDVLEEWSHAARTGSGAAWPVVRPLRARSLALGPLAGRLRELESAGALTATLAEVAEAHVESCLGRLLCPAAGRQLLVVYDFLVRLHRSRVARAALPGLPAPHPPTTDPVSG